MFTDYPDSEMSAMMLMYVQTAHKCLYVYVALQWIITYQTTDGNGIQYQFYNFYILVHNKYYSELTF